jgi:hypothetical protein
MAMTASGFQLPQSYLADLPAEAELTASLVREAWLAIQRNHAHYLSRRTTAEVAATLEEAAGLWLEAGSPYLKLALERGPAELGFSRPTLERGLRSLFASITGSELEIWVEQDLHHAQRLDQFCASPPERAGRRQSFAIGPVCLAQVLAGNLPAPSVMSLVAGVLVRSAQFLKCAQESTLIPRLFAHSLRAVDARLAACIEIAQWPRERRDLLEALLESADCVTATGSDAAVTDIRNACPVTKRFVPYGHKVSFCYLAADALTAASVQDLLHAVATDVAAWDQLGCLSPHVIYVEAGGTFQAEQFAGQLAETLKTLERRQPRGTVSAEEAATIRSRRAFYEIRAAHGLETRLWQSEGSTAWTVVYEADPKFQPSCLNRFVYVKSAEDLEDALRGADAVRHHTSTVALAAPPARSRELATRLAQWGVSRVCAVGRMQVPPLAWRHDGRPALGDLVRWSDWEQRGYRDQE